MTYQGAVLIAAAFGTLMFYTVEIIERRKVWARFIRKRFSGSSLPHRALFVLAMTVLNLLGVSVVIYIILSTAYALGLNA